MIKIQILSKASNQVLASFELMEGEMKEFSETEVLALFKEEATIEVVEGEGLGLREDGDMVFLFSNGETLRFRKYYPLVEEGRIAQADIQGIEVPAPDVVSVDTDSFDLDEDSEAFDLDIEEREGRSSDPTQTNVVASSPALAPAVAPFFVQEPVAGNAFAVAGPLSGLGGEFTDVNLPLSRGRIVDDFYSIQLKDNPGVAAVTTEIPTVRFAIGTSLTSLLAQNGPLFSRGDPYVPSVESNDTYEDIAGKFPALRVERLEQVPVRDPDSKANNPVSSDFTNKFTVVEPDKVGQFTRDPKGEFNLQGNYGEVWVGRTEGKVVYQINNSSEVRAALFGVGKDGYVQDVFRVAISLPNFDALGNRGQVKPEFAVRIFGINDELKAHNDQPLWPAELPVGVDLSAPLSPSNPLPSENLRVILVVERASAEMNPVLEPVGGPPTGEIHLVGRDLIGASAPANSLFANDIDADLKVGVIRVTEIAVIAPTVSQPDNLSKLVVTAPGHGLKAGDLVALDGLVGSSIDGDNVLAGKPLSELNTQFKIDSVSGDTFTVRVATAFGGTFTLTDPANGGSGMVAVVPSAIGGQNPNPLDALAGTSTLVVYAPDHRLVIGDTVVLRGISGTVGGVNGSDINGLHLVVSKIENGGKFNVSVPGKVFNDSIPGSVTDLLNVGGADVTLQKVGVFGTSGNLTAVSNERPADLEWVVFPLKSASTITGAGDVAADNEAGVQTLERTTPTALTVIEVRATNGSPVFRVVTPPKTDDNGNPISSHGMELGDRVTLAGLPLSIGGVNLMTDGGNVRTFTVTGISGLNQVLITEDKPTPVTATSNQTASALVGAGMTETAVLLQGQFGDLVFRSDGSFTYTRNFNDLTTAEATANPKDGFVVQLRDEANLRMQELRIQIPVSVLGSTPALGPNPPVLITVGGHVDQKGPGTYTLQDLTGTEVPGTWTGFTLAASGWTGFNVTKVEFLNGVLVAAEVKDNDPGVGDLMIIKGQYGTLTVNRWSGHYTYVVDQKSTVVEALTQANVETETFRYTVFDGNRTDDNAGALSKTAVLTLTIRGSNDSPALDVKSSLAATGQEDGIVVLTGGALADGLRGSRNLATILSETLGDTETLVEGDPDDVGSGLTYTLDVVPNAASEGSIVKLASAGGAVSEELGLNATFTHLDVTQGLIGFRPVANFNTNPEALGNTPVKVTLSLSDGGEDGSLALNGIVLNLTVTAVNDRPVLSVTSGRASYTENEPAAIIDAGVTVVDVDDVNVTGATVTISAGLTLGDVLGLTESGGVTGVYTAGTGTLVLSGTATKAVYETVLRSVTFVSTSEDPTSISGTREITFAVTDQNASLGPNGVLTGTIKRVIDITAINDSPVLVATASALTYTESAGRAIVVSNPVTVIDPNVALSDVDDTQMAGATVTIAAGLVAGDVLGFANQNGISGSYNAGTGVLTLSGTASVANYQAALRSVTYSTTSDNPTVGGAQPSRTINFAVTDANSDGVGAQTSAVVSRTINITAVNDAPDAGGNFTVTDTAGAAVAIIEDAAAPGAANIRLNVATLADPDSAAPTQIRILSVTGGTLQAADGSAITVAASGTLLTVTSNSVDFRFTPDLNRDTNATFTYAVVDATDNTLNSAASTATVTITPVNDAPVLVATVANLAYSESAGRVGVVPNPVTAIDPGLTLTDADDTQMVSATVTIAAGLDSAGDVLGFTNQNGISGTYNAGTGVLTLTGTASVANYQTALRSVTYSTTSDNPTVGGAQPSRTINFVVTDANSDGVGAQTSTVVTRTIDITAVNDAPDAGGNFTVTAAGGATAVAIIEDAAAPGAANIRLNVATLADPDSAVPTQIRILSVAGGTLLAADGSAITVGAGGTLLTVTSNSVDLRFTPDLNRDTNATFTYAVVDATNNTLNSAASTATVTITSVNDAPVLNFGPAAPNLSAAGTAIAPAAGITVTDVELSALNGTGDFRGASLVVRRDVAVVASDTFTFAPIGGVTVVPTGTGGNFQIAGNTFASFNNVTTAGQVTVTFAAAALAAIPGSVVNSVMQALLFDNNTVSNGDSVVLQYTFSDGNSGTQGSGGVGTFVGTRTITVVAPVVLDLDGDGLNFVGANSADALRFDVSGDGVEDSLAWVKSGDGALVYDADGDGKVSHRSEFVFTDWGGGRTDLEALAANFDSNSDGQLTDLDADWSKFKIWQDLDSDGIFGTSELVSLDGMGILGLNLATSGSAISGLNDVKLHGLGTFEWADGSAGTLGDAAFAYTQGMALPPANEILNIDHGGVAVLPEIPMMTSIPMMGPAPTGPSPVVASHTGSNESSTVTTTPESNSSGEGSAPPSTAPLDEVPVDAPAAVV